jgi:hypothetical protein
MCGYSRLREEIVDTSKKNDEWTSEENYKGRWNADSATLDDFSL